MFSRRFKRRILFGVLGALLAGTGYETAARNFIKTGIDRAAESASTEVRNDILEKVKNIAFDTKDTADSSETTTYAVSGELLTWNGAESIPDYTGQTFVELNSNIPYFADEEKTTEVFENYSELDSLGRCGVAYANICKELMPTEERGNIGMIKPSGWHTVKYPDLIDGMYLYNRCHLIAFCLAGENANEKNLITGTRYFNVTGMLPYETEVADYVDNTNNHVLYRVTPIFVSDELVARGVEIEAYSVEDNGAGVCFHVFVYNEQPGITIDHLTGDSST